MRKQYFAILRWLAIIAVVLGFASTMSSTVSAAPVTQGYYQQYPPQDPYPNTGRSSLCSPSVEAFFDATHNVWWFFQSGLFPRSCDWVNVWNPFNQTWYHPIADSTIPIWGQLDGKAAIEAGFTTTARVRTGPVGTLYNSICLTVLKPNGRVAAKEVCQVGTETRSDYDSVYSSVDITLGRGNDARKYVFSAKATMYSECGGGIRQRCTSRVTAHQIEVPPW